MSLPRSLARVAVVGAVSTVLVALGAGSASAHVSVSSADAEAGGYGKLTFRVPNESDTASTVRVRIQLPTDQPFASMSSQPVPGWTATATRTQVDPPLEVHGEEVSSAVSVVEFAADQGTGIRPGEFQEFSLSGGPFPDAGSLSFNVVQTYSDGNEAAWIEPTVDGGPEPEFPAPVLTLSASSAPATGSGGTGTAGGDPAAQESGHGGGATESAPAGLALFVAILALLTAVAGVVLGWRAHRRTVSS